MGRRIAAERYLLCCTTALGDSLFATPAIRFLRQRRPASFIALVAKFDLRDLFQTNPHIDRLVDYRNNALWRSLAHWRVRRHSPYDAVFCFHVGEDAIQVLGNVPRRRLYCLQPLKNLPPDARRCRTDIAHHRQWEDFTAMVAEEVGGEPDNHEFELPLAPANVRRAQSYFARFPDRSGPRVGLQLGGSHLGKCWPPQRFAALTERLLRRFGGSVFINATPSEDPLWQAYRAVLPPEALRHSHRLPRTTINGLAALLRELDLVVSNDTGPLHVALAQDRPVIALKAHDDHTFPYTLPRETPLRRCVFVRTNAPTAGKEYQRSHRAMECIPVEAVWNETQAVLQRLGFAPAHFGNRQRTPPR